MLDNANNTSLMGGWRPNLSVGPKIKEKDFLSLPKTSRSD